MFRFAMVAFGLSGVLLCGHCISVCNAQSNLAKETRVTLEDVAVITSDDVLRKSTDQIVFLRGVVFYDDSFKNPISILRTNFGKTYSCRGIEKHKGSDVVVAAVPQGNFPVDRSVGGVRTDEEGTISLVYARVVGVANMPKK